MSSQVTKSLFRYLRICSPKIFLRKLCPINSLDLFKIDISCKLRGVQVGDDLDLSSRSSRRRTSCSRRRRRRKCSAWSPATKSGAALSSSSLISNEVAPMLSSRRTTRTVVNSRMYPREGGCLGAKLFWSGSEVEGERAESDLVFFSP